MSDANKIQLMPVDRRSIVHVSDLIINPVKYDNYEICEFSCKPLTEYYSEDIVLAIIHDEFFDEYTNIYEEYVHVVYMTYSSLFREYVIAKDTYIVKE